MAADPASGPPIFQRFASSPDATCLIDATLCDSCHALIEKSLLPAKADFQPNLPIQDKPCELCGLIALESRIFFGQQRRPASTFVDDDDKDTGFWVSWQGDEADRKLRFTFRATPSSTNEQSDEYSHGNVLVTTNGVIPVPDCYPATPDNLDLIRNWMDVCAKHEVCQQTRLDSQLPKRVLDISRGADDKLVFLPQESSEKAPYATWSYCWGGDLPLKTTKSNLTHHMEEGVLFEAFPRTMRMAMSLAAALGFRYIWIDALCIIQDDDADWQEQATAMTAIYQACSLNIAVADSVSGHHGATRTLQHNSLRMGTVITRDGNAETTVGILALCEPDPEGYFYGEHVATLDRRGWVLQETLVSPASLFLCHYGLIWECCSRSCRQSDGRSYDLQSPIGGGGMWRFETPKMTWASNVSRMKRLSRGESVHEPYAPVTNPLWALYTWIMNMSECQLSFPKDKLPALSGMVSQMAAATKATYVAGLWKEDLILGLTWRRVHRKTLVTVRRPWRAPSWSWASIDGPVEWLWCISVNTRYPADLDGDKELDLDVLDVVVDEIFPGSFGEFKPGGRIEAIATLYTEIEFKSDRHFFSSYSPSCFYDSDADIGDAERRKARYYLRVTHISAFHASPGKAKGCHWYCFLIVEKEDEESERYRRIGYAHIQDGSYDASRNAERKRLTLV